MRRGIPLGTSLHQSGGACALFSPRPRLVPANHAQSGTVFRGLDEVGDILVRLVK
jgi:hypothetical protein